MDGEPHYKRLAESRFATIKRHEVTIEHLMKDRLRVQHMDMYFEENKTATDMFIKWLRRNPYPEKEA